MSIILCLRPVHQCLQNYPYIYPMFDFTKYNLQHPLDLSIPLRGNATNVSAWYVNPPVIEPVVSNNWIGEVKQGGSVNFRNIFFNPHGHGTHTECVGHISSENYSINQLLKTFFFRAFLVSAHTEHLNGDEVITLPQLNVPLWHDKGYEALVVRTLPNASTKLSRQYSNTNPPYLHHEAALFLRNNGIKHLLIDLPSVDREEDGGKLLAHRAFWDYPHDPRLDATITELIYVDDSIKDGEYLLNLQIAPFENDASPSKPVLYPLL